MNIDNMTIEDYMFMEDTIDNKQFQIWKEVCKLNETNANNKVLVDNLIKTVNDFKYKYEIMKKITMICFIMSLFIYLIN